MPPGSPAGPPAGPPQGQPPIGSSPATGPTQNLGLAAKGIQAAGAVLNAMAMVIPLVGAHTPLGQSLAKAMTDIGKHLQPGAASPQGERNFMQQMMQRQQQMAPQRAAVMSQQGPAPGGNPAGAGGPPPATPPMAA